MPIDRNNTNTSRPLKPTLATTRTAKTPVAPRLAPSVASVSSTASRTPRSVVGSTHEDVTPVKPFIHGNVTPRSSTRKSRVGVGSASSTPSSTPSVTPISTVRPASTIDFPQKELAHGYAGPGVKRPNSALSKRPKSVVGGNSYSTTPTPRPPLSNIYNHAPHAARGESSPMFFHASNVRAQSEQLPPQKKAPVFFYANGEQDESSQASEVPSPPLSSVSRSERTFFHADSTSEGRGNLPPILTPPPLSASPEPWSNLNPSQSQLSLRPPSPSKENTNMHLSYRKGVSQVLRPSLHRGSSALSILSGTHTPEPGAAGSRISSATSSTVRFGHAKSASLSSIDSTNSLKKVTSQEQPVIIPSPLHNTTRVISDGSAPGSIASAPLEPTLPALPSPDAIIAPNPAPGQSVLEHMNELAANARRERKVLDLEISNSSLLAINRSLEREVRKQKAELRRFRRMSRAGRFSTETNSNLEEFSAIGISELGGLSDMSEKEEEVSEDSGDSSFDESVMSVTKLADRDAAYRSRDEKRLQLDLSKHRELLVDSQKMNQSLGRCLTWTEELIKDAQKALAYQVRVSDVQLGGRVLVAEEEADVDQDEESKGLLSPWTPPHRATDPDSSPLSMLEGKERDSGVDLDGLQSIPGIMSPLGSPLGETLPRPPPTSRGFEMPP